jgi:hypothetical protein
MLIDELLLCKKELQGGDADSPLGEVLASGRKALHIVIGCSQLGQVDVWVGSGISSRNGSACGRVTKR